MASKQGTAINIGDGSSEMKRKNIELSMNSLQARLNKVSAKKGNEKQQQKLALEIEKLKAQLAYNTAKTPTEKQNALASIKHVAMLAEETGECKSIDSIKIVKKAGCIGVKFATSKLSVRDTTTLQFIYIETNQPVPADKLLDVSLLIGDGSNGYLLPSSGVPNVTLNGFIQPIQYIAPDSLQGDSLLVYIRAAASDASGTGGDASASLKGTSLSKATEKIANIVLKSIKGPNGKTIQPQSLSRAMIKALAEPACMEGPSGEVAGPKLVVDSLIGDNNSQFISGTDLPKMPNPVIKAQLKNFNNSTNGAVEFNWTLTIKWNAEGINFSTPLDKTEKYTGTASGQNSELVDLEVGQTLYGEKDMRGGDDITLNVIAKTVVDGKVYTKVTKNPFVIKGKNPSLATMLAELNGLKYEAIASKESNFNQFAPDWQTAFRHANQPVTTLEYPLQGGDLNDFGIMAIRFPNQYPFPSPNPYYNFTDYYSDDIIWNWAFNVRLGKQKFDKCVDMAGTYHTWKRFRNNDSPPTPLDANRQLIQAYCEYNGGYSARYWKWVKPDEKHNMPGYWGIDSDGSWAQARPYATDVWVRYTFHLWR